MEAIGELIGATVGLLFDLLISLISLLIRGFLHSVEFLYLVFTKGFSAACQNTKQSWADERDLRRQKQIDKKQQAATESEEIFDVETFPFRKSRRTFNVAIHVIDLNKKFHQQFASTCARTCSSRGKSLECGEFSAPHSRCHPPKKKTGRGFQPNS